MPKMPRKRTAHILTQAEARVAALRLLEPKLAFGGNLSLQAFTDKIDALRERYVSYKVQMSRLDVERSALDTMERELAQMTSRMLLATLVQFGSKSREYAMACGPRPNGRGRQARRATGGRDPSSGGVAKPGPVPAHASPGPVTGVGPDGKPKAA